MSDACTCPTTAEIRAAIQDHIDTAVRAERERIADEIAARRNAIPADWDPLERLTWRYAIDTAADIARQERTR